MTRLTCFTVATIVLFSTWLSAEIVAQEDRSWHLFTQSNGGTISLLHALTEYECNFAMNRALGRPATDDERERERTRNNAMWETANKACAKDKTALHSNDVAFGVHCEDGKATSIFMGGGTISAGNIKSAECFH